MNECESVGVTTAVSAHSILRDPDHLSSLQRMQKLIKKYFFYFKI